VSYSAREKLAVAEREVKMRIQGYNRMSHTKSKDAQAGLAYQLDVMKAIADDYRRLVKSGEPELSLQNTGGS
jgi:hypothetical protein